MPIDVPEQVRQLASAFDDFVHDVTADEVIERFSAKAETQERAAYRPSLEDRHRRPTSRSLGVAAAAVLLVAGLVGALAWIDRGGSAPSSPTSPRATDGPPPVTAFGPFVWPAPPRDYTTVDELVDAFADEVLSWDEFDVEGDPDDTLGPQSFTLRHSGLDVSVPAIATPSTDGWGFVQIGSGLTASIDPSGLVSLDVPTDPSVQFVASGEITVRSSDGSIDASTSISGPVQLGRRGLDELVSALAIGYNANGEAILVAGGQFGADIPVSPRPADSLPATTLVDQAHVVPDSPLDFAPTDRPLPLWPDIQASDPPETTTGYGMHLCDSGYGTKLLRVDPADGASPSHAYSGTLCVFIDLAEQRVQAVTSCATATELFHYARCQRSTHRPDTASPGSAVDTVATAEQQTAMAAFPAATAWDQPELFDVDVSAATPTGSSFELGGGAIAVTLTTATAELDVDPPGVCFRFDLPGATVNGCSGGGLLATGLAYGAFRDGDGPIELIGIVPDEVTTVEIGGTTVTPIDNVWHYTATDGISPEITVRSADGRTAATD